MNLVLNPRKTSFGRLLSCSLGLILFTAIADSTAKAGERVFEKYNFAITIPTNWEEVSVPSFMQPKCVGIYKPVGGKQILMVIVNESLSQGSISEEDLSEIGLGIDQKRGEKLVSSRFLEIGGVRAYERTTLRNSKGNPVPSLMQLVLADGKMYTMQATLMQLDGANAHDEEIRKIMSSFRFLVPVNTDISSARSQSEAYSAGHKLGYFVAQNIGTVIILGVALVGFIFHLVRKRARRIQNPDSLNPPAIPK